MHVEVFLSVFVLEVISFLQWLGNISLMSVCEACFFQMMMMAIDVRKTLVILVFLRLRLLKEKSKHKRLVHNSRRCAVVWRRQVFISIFFSCFKIQESVSFNTPSLKRIFFRLKNIKFIFLNNFFKILHIFCVGCRISIVINKLQQRNDDVEIVRKKLSRYFRRHMVFDIYFCFAFFVLFGESNVLLLGN